jgi:hypothetical protein
MGLQSPKVCIKIAQKAVQLLKLDCSIVDIVQHRYTGEYFVLEVNPALGVFNEAAIKSGTPVFYCGNESYKNDHLKLELLTKLIVNKLKTAPFKSRCIHPNISNSLRHPLH